MTSERVASAKRERTKQRRPQRMQAMVRMTPVLLARLTPRGLGARSAWVMAGGVIVGKFH